MTIEAKVVAHSRADGAPDLITLQVKYPRMVHSELMTHRVFSRNASSSRAIPIERMIRDVEEDPAMPVAWGSNKPGMQAGKECDNWITTIGRVSPFKGLPVQVSRERAWLEARDHAVRMARGFAEAGYHKQIVNRLLEPFAHITVVVTATDWDNFFDLRCHPDADPTMRAVAEAMRDAIAGSTPSLRPWHLPYVNEQDWRFQHSPAYPTRQEAFNHLAMISAARCARVSYLNHDGTSPDIEKDLALAKRLLDSKHMSPFEHQAQFEERDYRGELCGNFNRFWKQHRKTLEYANA